MRHETIEKSLHLMMVLIVVAISIGGLVEIIPLMMSSDATEPAENIAPYAPLRLAGRDVYVREGCYNCHSQMIRPFRSETERYGPYTTAGETVYDRPFQFGSKRTGPDLARVGARYSDDWHRLHLMNPRDLVPESNMPGYPWLAEAQVDGELITKKMRTLKFLGDPYTDEQIAGAAAAVEGRSEMDALIAYLQELGTNRRNRR
ncbi:MAG: cytochrome-c oxidase, cbb3-type subunit II [Gammaproteobacteria bacterium]|jgi:cytochrome c oxidase cbb3-type subunit 2|nr:cytochrome-c oxidase, cbb3-type subunit II [Gammaproteobacteria bacterium]MDH5240665.1 cytochrome-c oxidase, cbb3-type subunit II [Gammaproteobacteria bacterium]MDH5260534.1 cytochrome-c oxidase, cbb3-type subunit II [Gammaproteobacteria bacterium]MDH5583789.1 cytochrome-c oxidase, cbb3-type subunit II [Gammaproteobacteria bacterium]